MHKYIKVLFEHFYSKVHRHSYNLGLDRYINQKLIHSFEQHLQQYVNEQTIGINLLIDYFAFAFGYYSDKKLQRNISLNWIIGKKMIKRFFERQEGWDYYTQKFLHEYQVNVDELKSRLQEQETKEEKDYLKIHKSEELEKARTPDTEARVYSCLNTTTLFNHRSTICVMCHQKVFCKQLLRKTNQNLYEKRGYK